MQSWTLCYIGYDTSIVYPNEKKSSKYSNGNKKKAE